MQGTIRLHGVVLARPFAKALALAAAGIALATFGWPAVLLGLVFLASGAGIATAAAWRWQRGLFLVTPETAAVLVERPLLGRVLGYGTLVAGELEIPYVRLRD